MAEVAALKLAAVKAFILLMGPVMGAAMVSRIWTCSVPSRSTTVTPIWMPFSRQAAIVPWASLTATSRDRRLTDTTRTSSASTGVAGEAGGQGQGDQFLVHIGFSGRWL